MQLVHPKHLARYFITVAIFILALVSTKTVFAGQNKVEVCHMEDSGYYHLITIAEPAFQYI